MKALLKKTLTSPAAAIAMIAVWAVALALATVIEKYAGTEMAKRIIYFNPVFMALLLAIISGFIGIVLRRRLLRSMSWGGLAVHAAFIIILAGAAVTHFFGQEGVLHLREGERGNEISIHTSKGVTTAKLPFEVELQKFNLVRYPGSASPSSFESEVTVYVDGRSFPAKIFMNHVLDIKGYRLFQSSFDSDEKGTILSVNRDVPGRIITYAGYILLLAGFLLFLAGPRSRFAQLRRKLKELKSAAPVIAAIIFAAVAQSSSAKGVDTLPDNIIPAEIASRFGAMPMQSYNGRVMPVNTFASDIIRKVSKARSIGDYTPDQFLLSLMVWPERWMNSRIIEIPNRDIRNKYLIDAKRCSFLDIFDINGSYLIQQEVEEAYRKSPAERSKYDKDILKLNEQINLLYDLFDRQLLNIFPLAGDEAQRWIAPGNAHIFAPADSAVITRLFDSYINNIRTTDANLANATLDSILQFQSSNATFTVDTDKIDAELRYNRLNPFRICRILYLSLGGILLVIGFATMIRDRKWLRWTGRALGIVVLVVFHYQMLGMGMRWRIGGYAPWSNGYETMIYVAWASVCGGLLFARRSIPVLALAVLFGGIMLFVSGLSTMDPQINLLAPVLKSPWLMFHVAVIVAAYGFFGIGCLLGLYNLTLLRFADRLRIPQVRITELTVINEMSLWIGLALMTVGTFLGAVWANESWGRYWGWDPKETWALICILAYAIVLHLRMVPRWNNPRLFNLAAAIAFAVVLMTYFGVNYLLSGMHSYAN